MKQIVRYEADDGSVWTTEGDARQRDILIALCSAAVSCLKPHPESSGGMTFVQQDAAVVASVRESLFEIANRPGVLQATIASAASRLGKTFREMARDVDPSWFGRMLDGAHEPLAHAYLRLMCIDANNREWEQPYFARNPNPLATVS